MKKRMLLMAMVLSAGYLLGDVSVKNVQAMPRWPWNGKMDITYSIECDETDKDGNPAEVYVSFKGTDNDRGSTFNLRYLTGDGANKPVKAGGPYTVTWDASKDRPELNSSSFTVSVSAFAGIAPYLVVDLSGGPNAASYPVEYSFDGPDVTIDACRTKELWLRRIPAGTFMMGSPKGEVGRCDNETQHSVTITQMFYIGVFECTQRQWELVMGSNPSCYTGRNRPVEQVSYNMIRGTGEQAGAGWPTYGHAVDGTSFMGKLQAKTGLVFDLPTEAQWEYACRLKADGTWCKAALNSGKNLTHVVQCPNLDMLGRYDSNKKDGARYGQHTQVGSYSPSELGLYDMHGNVNEWCLDRYASSFTSEAVKDPVGPAVGLTGVYRGGSWKSSARDCRAASRFPNYQRYSDFDIGFRLACFPSALNDEAMEHD